MLLMQTPAEPHPYLPQRLKCKASELTWQVFIQKDWEIKGTKTDGYVLLWAIFPVTFVSVCPDSEICHCKYIQSSSDRKIYILMGVASSCMTPPHSQDARAHSVVWMWESYVTAFIVTRSQPCWTPFGKGSIFWKNGGVPLVLFRKLQRAIIEAVLEAYSGPLFYKDTLCCFF